MLYANSKEEAINKMIKHCIDVAVSDGESRKRCEQTYAKRNETIYSKLNEYEMAAYISCLEEENIVQIGNTIYDYDQDESELKDFSDDEDWLNYIKGKA